MSFWNVVGFALMGEDKDQAVMQEDDVNKERISERTLHEVAFAGGFIGIILGAKAFRHKVSKPSFWPPVAIAVVLWAVLFYYVAFGNMPERIG